MPEAGAITKITAACSAIGLALLGAVLPNLTIAAPLRVLLARPATVEATPLVQSAAGQADTTLRLRLRTADGGNHELRLRPKNNLGVLSARVGSRAQAYHGYLPQRQGSWAALTRIGDRWTGLWFDGVHYYALDTAEQLAAVSQDASRARGNQILVYRLTDATFGQTNLSGDLRRMPRTAESLAETLTAELASLPPPKLQATIPTKQVLVALLGDPQLTARDGAQTEANMLARLNIVDEVFATQTGVRVLAGSVTIFDAANEPFTQTSNSSTLLDEVAAYRAGSTVQRAAGFTHLMSGRDLDSNTVGIAYLSSLCNGPFGASLSEARSSIDFSALIAAHEIGHVFGAPHDGDTAEACAATPSGFLMAPQLSGSRTFSACSLEQIAKVVAAAQCLAPVDAADATVEVAATAILTATVPKDIPITVRSIGNVTIVDAILRITLPASVSFVSGNAGANSCTSSANVATCALGNLPAGTNLPVSLRVLPTTVGSSSAILRVLAGNDALAANDTATVQFQTEVGTDLALAATGSVTTLTTGATFTATFVAENRGPAAVSDARLTLTVPSALAVTQQVGEGFNCTTTSNGLSCGPLALGVGATGQVRVTLRADAAGIASVTADLSSTTAELAPANNAAQVSVTATAPAPTTPPSQSGGSGGGGGWSLWTSAGLALLLGLRHAQNRRRGKPQNYRSGRLPRLPA